jgi:hypothetical protein
MIEDKSPSQLGRGESGRRIGPPPTCCVAPDFIEFHNHESSIRRYLNVPVF